MKSCAQGQLAGLSLGSFRCPRVRAGLWPGAASSAPRGLNPRGVGAFVASCSFSLQLRAAWEEAAQSLPSLASYWNNASDGLDALRRLVPTALHPTAVELETLGDIPQNWLIFYQIKIMCVNAHSSHNASMRREMELLLSAQGFDSFARNYSLGAILLAIILFVFGVMVYVSFRLRAFGWLEAPISLAEMLPGAFAPERLADPDFDPSRQKKQLPYRVVKGQLIARPSSISHNLSSFFQGIFGVYASWLLLCIRIPPEKAQSLD